MKRLGKTDHLPFGKYKGKTVLEVLVENRDYILWLRDSKRKTEALEFFDDAVNSNLDNILAADPHLAAKYTAKPKQVMTPAPVDPAMRETAYAGQWGAW